MVLPSEESILEDGLESAYFEILGASPSITVDFSEAEVALSTELEYELGQLIYSSPSEDGYQVTIQQDESSSFVSLT